MATKRKSAKPASAPAAKVFAANDRFKTVADSFGLNADAVRENAECVRTRFQSFGADLIEAARQDSADAVAFLNDLVKAKTVGDALEIQRNYWTNLYKTRVERTREWTNLSVETARESFKPFAKTLAALPGYSAFEKAFPFGAK